MIILFLDILAKKTIPDYWDKLSKQKEPGRWHFYRLRAEGKNCMVINPDIRPEQNENGKAVLKRAFKDGLKSGYTVDLSDCYLRDALYYTRTITMNRPERKINVVDTVVCNNKSSEIYWFMHTKADIRLSDSKKSAVLNIKGKKLSVEILSPTEAVFSIMSAESLFKNDLPYTKNTVNNEFKKLCIHLTDIEKTNIQVCFDVVESVSE